MARRAPLISKKAKKPKVTRNEAYLVNLKYLGDEPTFKEPLSQSDYATALNWYNYMCDTNDAREYLETYLKNTNRVAEAKKIKRVSDTWIVSTAAWACRMISKDYTLPESAKPFVEKHITQMLSRATKEEPKIEEKPTQVVSIQERMRERQSEIIGEIEGMIDDTDCGTKDTFNLYDWLKSNQIPATYCSSISAKYSKWLAELIETLEGKDDQLKEAYSYLTKKQLRDRIDFFNNLINDVERYSNVTKKTRTPRKPRTVSVEKKLKNLKFQKESKEYKIASVNPEKVIGCQELWTFNTKYKVVTVFRAIDRGGLQVKGTSIIGYDEKTSLSKGCGRKPEIVLDKLQNGGKIVLKKLMEELKTDKALQYRLNENTILMKVTT
jgi:hypothetical protein